MNPGQDGRASVDQRVDDLSAHAEQLRYRSEASGDAADLAEAVRLGREAYRAGLGVAPDVQARAAFRLATTLAIAFERTGDAGRADEALELLDATDRLLPAGHPEHAAVSTNRAAVLINRYLRTGAPAHLDTAIAEARRGIALATDDDPRQAARHSNLGSLLRTRFQATGALADLDAAIEHNRSAVLGVSGQERQPAAFHASLAASLVLRFAATYAKDDLAEGIEAARRALAFAPEAGPMRWMALGVLAGALKADFERSGGAQRLGEAIDCLRETTDLLPRGHADLPANLGNLAHALLKRYERFAAREDLEEAIAAARRALEPGHAAIEAFMRRILASALLRLGQLLTEEGETSAALAACDEALREADRSVLLLPLGHPDRADAYTILGNAWVSRFQAGHEDGDARQAAAAYQQAIDATTPDDPRRALMQTNLGVFHLKRADADGPRRAQDLADAAHALRQAIDLCDAGDPAWAQATASLAVTLMRAASSPSELDEALALLAELDDASGAPPRIRLAAYQMTAIVHLAEGDVAGACAAYAAAVELLPQTAWHGLGQVVKERELADRTGLGSDAAAAYIAAGAPERALELLEQGRGVLWSQRLARRFVDARLEAVLPDHARRLRELTQALDTVG